MGNQRKFIMAEHLTSGSVKNKKSCLVLPLCLSVLFLILTSSCSSLRVGEFKVEVNPPPGHPLQSGLAAGAGASLPVEHNLYARGIVLDDGRGTYVLVSVDLLGISNSSWDQLRDEIAAAVDTDVSKVYVSCGHQHTAPGFDKDTQLLCDPYSLVVHDSKYHEDTIDDIAAAAANATLQIVTDIGYSATEVYKVGSTRRIQNKNSIIARVMDMTDKSACFLPEGYIDPVLRTVGFFNNQNAIVHLHFYASHPEYHANNTRVTYSPTGIAIEGISTSGDQIYFQGAAGDIDYAKYGNHPSISASEQELADRLRAAMETNINNMNKEIVSGRIVHRTSQISWPRRSEPEWADSHNKKILADARKPVGQRIKAAMVLAANNRVDARTNNLAMMSLEIGSVQLLFLPGETFVDYQLYAQLIKQNEQKFLAAAAYGDTTLWYMGDDEIYTDSGGYEQTWALGGPLEQDYRDAISEVLVGGVVPRDFYASVIDDSRGEVILSWKAASGLALDRYEIYRDSYKIAEITNLDVTSYKDSPTNPEGNRYIYTLKCVGPDASKCPQIKTITAFGTGGAPRLYSLKTVYTLGEKLSFAFTDGPGNKRDWIAVVPRGCPVNKDNIKGLPLVYNDPDMTYYVPDSGPGPDHRNLLVKRTPVGEFDAYLMQNDGYTVVAGPVEFSVVSAASLEIRERF